MDVQAIRVSPWAGKSAAASMPIGNGKFIKPTGKAFKMPMCTVGHWKNGVTIEESLFWDNQTYADQIGLGK